MAIHLHFSDDGQLDHTNHFVYDKEQAMVWAGVNRTDGKKPTVFLQVGTVTVFMTVAQAEETLAQLAGAVERAMQPVAVAAAAEERERAERAREAQLHVEQAPLQWQNGSYSHGAP